MCKKVIIAGIVGGIVYFIWSSVSWMLLPYHRATIHHFKDEAQVVKVLQDNTDVSGVYVLPKSPQNLAVKNETESTSDSKASFQQAFSKGPLVYMGYSKEGADPTMKRQLLMWFLGQLIGAFLIASLLISMKETASYFCRLAFVIVVGILIGFLGNLPSYVWWHQGLDFTIVNVLDDIIGWGLAGLFMAKLTMCKKKNAE